MCLRGSKRNMGDSLGLPKKRHQGHTAEGCKAGLGLKQRSCCYIHSTKQCPNGATLARGDHCALIVARRSGEHRACQVQFSAVDASGDGTGTPQRSPHSRKGMKGLHKNPRVYFLTTMRK